MRKIVLALALAGTFLSAPANARDGAIYAGVSGGAVFGDGFEANLDLDDDDSIDDDEIAILDFDTETGWELEGLAGYDFGMFRAEAEGAYKSIGVGDLTTNSFVAVNPLAPVTQTQFDTDGDISVLSVMANGMVDLGGDEGINFFAGGGLGYGWVDLDSAVINTADPYIDDSSGGFAWQLLGGARLPISRSIDIGLKYKYFKINDLDMVDRYGDLVQTGIATHSLLASLLVNFGGDPEPVPVAPLPPRAAPPPPPPPPPPPQTRTCPDGSVRPVTQACPAPPPPAVAPIGERG